MNGDRPALRDAAGNKAGQPADILCNRRNASVRNWKRQKLHSTTATEFGLALKLQFGDLLPFEQTHDRIDALALPLCYFCLKPVLGTRTSCDGQPASRWYIDPMQSGHRRELDPVSQHKARAARFANAIA